MIYQCKMCGGDLNITDADNVVECDYCGTVQTVPFADDEKKMALFNRANRLRLANEFDKAAGIYESIVAQFPREAEAYWGLCLCNYGIEYVDDPATGKKIPTCHRSSFTSILEDDNFDQTLENADVLARKVYRDEAKVIEEIRKGILEVSSKEAPYDIFICYKETDTNGERTVDSVIAQDVYDALTQRGFRVFFSRITLEDKLGQEYEPYIFAALNSAKVMLVFGTDYEHFNAVWVKNEWSRFLRLMAKEKDKVLIPCYKGVDAYDMPREFAKFQAQDMGKVGAMQDLLRGIEKLLPSKNKEMSNRSEVSSPSKKELSFKNGVYVGEAIANRPHGFGTRYYDDGSQYVGQWKMGKQHGKGTITYKSGSSWTGEWEEGIPKNGEGTYYYTKDKKRCCVVGRLENSSLNGPGKRYVNGQLEKSGIFKNWQLHGQGTYYVNGHPACEGVWNNGKPWDAQGTFSSMGDWFFTGTWKNGKPLGKGTFYSKSSGTVKGVFKEDFNSDEVNWKLPNECSYIGPLKNGSRTGKGKLYDKNGKLVYEGDFIDGACTGAGTCYYSDGSVYCGSVEKLKRVGQGTLTYPQGQTWNGVWKDDARWNGTGWQFYYGDDGNLNGNSYCGSIVDGELSGQGVLHFYDGTRFEGVFLKGQYHNGYIYSASNRIVDTISNGISKSQKRSDTIMKIADFLS
ncbi:MAG: TIR domain-containing protein [Clostridia bacterium]|nr:TIR domain-containing protein [Clostridia bacterium]